MNIKHLLIPVLAAALTACASAPKEEETPVIPSDAVCLANQNIEVAIGADGSLVSLRNVRTGHDYAGGGLLWRLYYDAPNQKEIQIQGSEQKPEISLEGNVITLRYPSLICNGQELDMQMTLTVTLEDDKVRFGSTLQNNEPHTVLREFHYPLVHGARLPGDHKLWTSEAGGKLFDDPQATLSQVQESPYKRPEQIFRQRDVKYGAKVFMNCFGLFGKEQGLYFGSHDGTFQDTWHGLRAYKGAGGAYDCLEFGFFKYPHCFCGESWSCDANVVAPYSGTWHVASGIYRRWVDTWWDHRESPLWLRELKSWQRVIFKHQYGEYLFKYPDINGIVDEAGRSVGCDALFLFGWWDEGMDHGNPDYSPDESQGGDKALKAEIARYQAAGGHLLLYYNGKLIDRESRFYRSGMGPKVCRHDNTGSEILERYKFTGQGTWLGEYDQRTFAVATMMDPDWNKVLCQLQDRAWELGAHSVFFDQLGYVERESSNWDTSREYPVPDVFGIQKRAECLKMLRDRYAEKAPDFALGAEGTVDALAQYCDYTHGYPANNGPEHWINFFRYTFPELIFTDRGQRDDVDAAMHVNSTVLDGQRNDIEIFRCRGIISDAPVYQAYLKQANELKEKYKECLLLGRYNDTFGFTCSAAGLDARSFLSEDGRKMAVVVANQDTETARVISASISAPGYHVVDGDATGGSVSGNKVKLGQFDMAVLLFEADGEPVRIGTYNLRRAKLDAASPVNNWEARAPRLVQSFLDSGFDICGVQEVDSAEQESLPRMLNERGAGYDSWFFGPYADDGVGTKAHGLLWKKDRFTLEGEPHFFWVSDPPELKQYNDSIPGHKYIRGGFCVTMKENSGRRIFVMVTHGPLNKEAHAQNARIFPEIEKKYNAEGLPSFFLGDFNARETDACSEIYRSWWTDSYHAFDGNPAARKGPVGTFNAWRWQAPPMERRIDFIYFRGKGVTPLRYVCDNTLFGGLFASDHFPVWVDFDIR
jgi:endonuclease/exonuclease/phosphatase family metal-dependent hydrolase